MKKWHKTGCVLCAQNCGLEVMVEDNRMVKVRGDKENPRSKGYVCRKGLNVMHHQHHGDRLTYPLKRTKSGFKRISWDQALSEIAERLGHIIGQSGPRSFAYMGGGGQGCHFEAMFGPLLLNGLGSKYHYNALAQELTGYFWVCGRIMGRQNKFVIPDEAHSEMILAIGWNGMVSHQMPRAPIVLKEFSKNPNKLLAVIDPRKSETARIADIHLPIRPGTDALLLRAMIAIILKQNWENRSYIEKHVAGFDRIRPWFENFDVKSALDVCQLPHDQVFDLCRELSRKKWCMHPDLGVLMNRHSTVTSYLQLILLAICGRLCVPGGNIIPGSLSPLGLHTDERDPNVWRTVATDFPAISGFFPPNVMPEEILSDHPQRLRAVMVCGSNPLRSYADTTAYERAFQKLDLLVTIELAMTETAELSDYVLPARSGYESWDSTFFPWTYPEIYFQMRRPIILPEGEPLECGEIFTRLADKMGLVPKIPDTLFQAAQKDRGLFGVELFRFLKSNPKAAQSITFIIAQTLGKQMQSAHLAALWGALQAFLVTYLDPTGEKLGPDEIFLRAIDGTGLIPEIPGDMVDTFRKNPLSAVKRLTTVVRKEPGIVTALPALIAKSAGWDTASDHLFMLWGLLRIRRSQFRHDTAQKGFGAINAIKRVTTTGRIKHLFQTMRKERSLAPLVNLTPVMAIAEDLFQAILDHPEGLWVGQVDQAQNMAQIKTDDNRFHLYIADLAEAISHITPKNEETALQPNPDYPLLLMAGRHFGNNANTLMRNPAWHKRRTPCTLAMNPKDADALGLKNGQQVKIVTKAGEAQIELEITEATRTGQVMIPHGFGLNYKGQPYGVNVNRLTQNTHRDDIAGTPLHRFVPCRIKGCE